MHEPAELSSNEIHYNPLKFNHVSILSLSDRQFSLGLGLAVGLAALLGVIKFRTDSYFPNPFILPRTPPQAVPLPPLEDSEDTSSSKS